jgi:hypothetical protein
LKQRSGKPSADSQIRKLLKPRPENLSITVGLDIWISGPTTSLVIESSIDGTKAEHVAPLTSMEALDMQAAGLEVKWPEPTERKPRSRRSGPSS